MEERNLCAFRRCRELALEGVPIGKKPGCAAAVRFADDVAQGVAALGERGGIAEKDDAQSAGDEFLENLAGEAGAQLEEGRVETGDQKDKNRRVERQSVSNCTNCILNGAYDRRIFLVPADAKARRSVGRNMNTDCLPYWFLWGALNR